MQHIRNDAYFNADNEVPTSSFTTNRADDNNSSSGGFITFLNTTVSLGCVSYVGYRLLRSYILPRFFKIPDPAAERHRQLENQISDLQNSMKFVMDSTVQTLNKVHEQQEYIRQVLSLIERNSGGESKQLESDVSIIKSLLLNPAVKLGGPDNIIPSWQQAQHQCEETNCWKPMTISENGSCSETDKI